MSIFTDTLGILRDRWTDEFVDSCVVKKDPVASFNTTTGAYATTYTTTFSGACLVRPAGASDSGSAGQQSEIRMIDVYVPYTVTDAEPDYFIDVTSTEDGYLNGRQLVVRNVQPDSYLAVRKLECEDVQNA